MKLAASGHDTHRHWHHWTPGWLVNLLAFALGLILAFAVYALLVSARAESLGTGNGSAAGDCAAAGTATQPNHG